MTNAISCVKNIQVSGFDGDIASNSQLWISVRNSNTNKNNSIISARDALKRVGIQFTGDENADLIGEICEVVTLPARFQLGDSSYKAALLPLAVCSVNATTVTPDIAQYDEVARFSKVLPTWVYVYKGDSNVIAQNEFQKSIYRSYIDSGAELVLGTSPYAVQGAESYKGKLILYSLGNFIYPGKESDSEFYKGIALSATISAKMDNNMSSWVDLAKACKDANDSCLGLAKDKGLSRPAYSYGLSIVATDNLKAGVVMKTTNSMWEEQASKRLGIDALLPTLDLLNR